MPDKTISSTVEKREMNYDNSILSINIPKIETKKNKPVKQDSEGNYIFTSIADIANLAYEQKEIKLSTDISSYAKIISFTKGCIEIAPCKNLPNLSSDILKFIQKNTKENWVVKVVNSDGGKTYNAEKKEEQLSIWAATKEIPIVKTTLNKFPGSFITYIRPHDNEVEEDTYNEELVEDLTMDYENSDDLD